ncbi:Uncharacterised protein [Kingella potus]|uniref:Uncharacterized protein n=1 Tax=Kingella potus TaxID=265175 RepID=A0A377QYP7_9NEIS|nr:hypothetical protein [Kingella potus]UOP01704.1 hypothetical protein LVJ84_06155 [Kingella potus]STQ99989.1 Uncharacterised protein [Kingella potus]
MPKQRKLIFAAALLFLFAAVKLAALYWWTGKQPAAEDVRCDLAAGCTLPDGAVLRFAPAAGLKTPFAITLDHAADAAAVSVSFSMRDMDMGFNRYDLRRDAAGVWRAQNVRLPLCTEARHDFLADVAVDGKVYRVPFAAY